MDSRFFKLFGAAISIGLLYLVLRTVDVHVVWRAIQEGDYSWAPLALALFLSMTGVRAVLWGCLLGPDSPLSAVQVFPHLMIGLMANNVLPGRLGEVVRAFTAGRAGQLARTRVFSSIVLERILDVVWLLMFATVAFTLDLPVRWPMGLAGTTAALLLGVSAVSGMLLWKGEALLTLVSQLIPRRARPRVKAEGEYYLSALLEGLKSFDSPLQSLWIIVLSGSCWFLWVGFLAATLATFQIDISALGLILLTGVINLGVMIPSAPGYVGPFQFACVQGLALFGVPSADALGVSLVLHALWYVPTTLLGLLFLWRLGFGFRTITALEVVGESGECDP